MGRAGWVAKANVGNIEQMHQDSVPTDVGNPTEGDLI